MLIKECARCHKHPRASNSYCLECNRARYDWATVGRANRYQKTYGITLEQYNQMLAAQGGTCAICGTVPGLRRLAVDHDHKTGEVRGLLCNDCNTTLGKFDDDPSLLEAAAQYLRRKER